MKESFQCRNFVEGKRDIWRAYDLECPYCGANDVVKLGLTFATGENVQCWVCKEVFVITAECWVLGGTFYMDDSGLRRDV